MCEKEEENGMSLVQKKKISLTHCLNILTSNRKYRV